MSDCIYIDKDAKRLHVMMSDRVPRSYPILLGKNSTADKAVEGDEATPLGDYFVCARNPRSRYFLSLCVSYPNLADAQRGLAAGLIDATEHAQIVTAISSRKMPPQHTRLGGEIYIHGSTTLPWTRGCIAVDNAAMQELYDLTPLGIVVRISRREPAPR